MSHVKKICRICMVDEYNGNLTSVFENEPQKNKTARDILLITGVQITDFPACPAMICKKCIENLSIAVDLRQKCKSTDKFLRETIGNETRTSWSDDEFDEITPYDVHPNIKAVDNKEPRIESVFLEYAETVFGGVISDDDDEMDRWKMDGKISNERQSGSRTNASTVWAYATKHRNPITKDIEGTCLKCGKVLKCSGGSTTSLKTHLKSKHDIDLTTKAEGSSARPSDPKRLKLKPQQRKSLAEVICDMATDGIPMRAITWNSYIRSSLKRDGYESLQNESAAMEVLFQEFLERKAELAKEIKDFVEKGNLLSVVLKNYISISQKSYLGISLHCRERKTFQLGLIRILDSDSIKTAVTKYLNLFSVNLENNVFGFTYTKSLKLADLAHQLCLNQGIHLGVCDTLCMTSQNYSKVENINKFVSNRDEFKESTDFQVIYNQTDQIGYHKTLQDVINLIHSIQNSPEMYQNFQSKYTSEFGNEANFSQDITWQWKNIPKIFNFLIKSKQHLKETFTEFGKLKIFKSVDFEALEAMGKSIEPIKLAVETLNLEDSTLSMAEIVIEFLYKKLEDLNTPISIQLYQNIKKRLDERHNEDVMKLLKCLKDPTVEPPPHILDFGTKIAQRLFGFSTENSSNLMEEDPQPPQNLSLQEELNYLLEKDKNSQSRVKHSILKAKKSLEQEFIFYRSTGIRSDILQKLFTAISILKPASTDIQRVFSYTTSSSATIVSGLTDESLNALTFLKCNLKKVN